MPIEPKKSLDDIRQLLRAAIDLSSQRLARATGRDALGALPGTYSNLDQPGQRRFGLTLMHVPMGKTFDDFVNERDHAEGFVDLRPILKFYTDHMAVVFRPDGEYDTKTYGRGYGVHAP